MQTVSCQKLITKELSARTAEFASEIAPLIQILKSCGISKDLVHMIAHDIIIGLKYESIEKLQGAAWQTPADLQRELEKLGLTKRKSQNIVSALSGDFVCVVS